MSNTAVAATTIKIALFPGLFAHECIRCSTYSFLIINNRFVYRISDEVFCRGIVSDHVSMSVLIRRGFYHRKFNNNHLTSMIRGRILVILFNTYVATWVIIKTKEHLFALSRGKFQKLHVLITLSRISKRIFTLNVHVLPSNVTQTKTAIASTAYSPNIALPCLS